MSLLEVAIEPLYFMMMGLFGSVLYVLVQSKGWDDFLTFEAWKRYILGPFSGLFYNYLHSDYNFPNSVMSIVFGYFSIDLIPWVMGALRKILESASERMNKNE